MMNRLSRPTVLIADDSPDDCLIVMRAWEESRLSWDIRFVHDGREVLDYLLKRRKYAFHTDLPEPNLVMLDLNMPRKDGRQVLLEIQAHPFLKRIPVVILTDSTSVQDVLVSDSYGAMDFINKPGTFDEYVRLIKSLGQTVQHQIGKITRGHLVPHLLPA